MEWADPIVTYLFNEDFFTMTHLTWASLDSMITYFRSEVTAYVKLCQSSGCHMNLIGMNLDAENCDTNEIFLINFLSSLIPYHLRGISYYKH